jgi:hypothetical protein
MDFVGLMKWQVDETTLHQIKVNKSLRMQESPQRPSKQKTTLLISPGNTKGESINVPLTYCLTGLESAL